MRIYCSIFFGGNYRYIQVRLYCLWVSRRKNTHVTYPWYGDGLKPMAPYFGELFISFHIHKSQLFADAMGAMAQGFWGSICPGSSFSIACGGWRVPFFRISVFALSEKGVPLDHPCAKRIFHEETPASGLGIPLPLQWGCPVMTL